MPYENWVRRNALVRRVNSAVYHYRTNRWRWDPRFRFYHADVEIDRPVFLLGTQGGGLTLISRILRRISNVVSATGNYRYWAGYDELQDVLYDVLPPELRLHPLRILARPKDLRGWLYASSLHFDEYRRSASDASPELARRFRRLLRGILRLNRPGDVAGPYRFLDKSQTFTVRIGLVHALLEDCQPKFVLIARDPYAMCWRAFEKVGALNTLGIPDRQKLALAIQHWKNSMTTALAEAGKVGLGWWRFEDFLEEPERIIREICEFADLDFSPEILPGAADRIPTGSMFDAFDRSKWYPIRAPVNRAYIDRAPAWAIDDITRECGDLIELLGYRSRG